MTEIAAEPVDNEVPESDSPDPPCVTDVVVTARGGFQSLKNSNAEFKAIFGKHTALADGTAGKVVQVPTAELPGLLRELANLLEKDFAHDKSGQKVKAAHGIDNWVIAIQAISPNP